MWGGREMWESEKISGSDNEMKKISGECVISCG